MEGLPARVERPLQRIPEHARGRSRRQSEKDVEQDPQYQQLEQAYKDAYETAKPRRDELQKQIDDLSAKILAVQNVFTDRRAYVNALTYELETETSASGKKSKQKDIDDYKKKKATVEFPDGHKQQYNFQRTGRDLQLAQRRAHQAERRTGRSAEAGHRGQQQDVRLRLRPHGGPHARAD